MTRPTSPILTEGELRLMNILWDRGQATVKELTEALSQQKLAYTTVLSNMQTLTQKGVVRHEKSGRAYLYYPVLKRHEARRSAVRYIMTRFFGGSPDSLVLNVLEHEEVDSETLVRLKKILEEAG